MNLKIISIICIIIQTCLALGETPALEKLEEFSGRVVKLNSDAGLLRVKVDFSNMRYLNKKDRIDFWSELNPGMRCKSYIVGKSNAYILLKVPDYKFCQKSVFFNLGSYLQMESADLMNNLKMGKELVNILLKKRLTIVSKLNEQKKEVDSHIEKIDALNKHYTVLKSKLETEWREEIANLEEDQAISLRNYKDLERQVWEVDYKLEQYQIGDENLKTDRWALDTRLFYKK